MYIILKLISLINYYKKCHSNNNWRKNNLFLRVNGRLGHLFIVIIINDLNYLFLIKIEV